MSHQDVIAAVAALIVAAVLIVLVANVIRGEDVSWRMSYTTRRRDPKHRDDDPDLSQDDDERTPDG